VINACGKKNPRNDGISLIVLEADITRDPEYVRRASFNPLAQELDSVIEINNPRGQRFFREEPFLGP